MRQSLESFLAWIGLLVLGGGYFASFSGLFRDPYYVFWAACGGSLLAAWFCYSSWTDRVDPGESGYKIYLPNGVEAADRKRPFRRPLLVRILSSIVFVAAMALVVMIVRSENARVFDLVYPTEPLLLEPAQIASIPGDDDRTKYKDFYDIPLGRQSVRFTLTKRPRIPWLEIESVLVSVDDYDPSTPPEGFGISVENYYKMEPDYRVPLVYTASIDAPEDGETKATRARFKGLESSIESANASLGSLVLDDDIPTPIIVNVSGKSPGVYTYSVSVVVRNLWRTQTVNIWSKKKMIITDSWQSDHGEVPVAPIGEPAPKPKLDPRRAPAPPP